MIPKYSQEEFNISKSRDKLLCECERCHQPFYLAKMFLVESYQKRRKNGGAYCSKICANEAKHKQIIVKCEQCGKLFQRHPSTIIKNKHQFCSFDCYKIFRTAKTTHHCAECGKEILRIKSRTINRQFIFCSKRCKGKYWSTHKTWGSSRSKFEIYAEQELTQLYPLLEINFNDTKTINAELDIYIASLKLAFEINGIFHYEPIFGADRLLRAQNNEQRKFQACLEHNIELCIIDITGLTHFTENKAKAYLNIIINLIENKLK